MVKDDILYISPITDFGFKKCFRDEIVMKGFLTALFDYAGIKLNIESLTYLNNESDGEKDKSRRVIYDIKCKLDTGEEFIIEMQNEKQSFLDKRITYYVARGISNQGDIIKQKGDTTTRREKKKWDYEINKVVGIFLLNFKIPGEENHKVSRNCFVDVNSKKKEITNDLVEYWKIQLPYFRRRTMKPENCKNELEYWLYNIANMDKMKDSVQFIDKTPALSRLGEVAKYHVLTRAEQERYMKEYDDYVVLKDVITTKYKEGADKGEKRGFQKGVAQGIAQGMAQGEHNAHLLTARQMKLDGMPIELIVKYTGLTAEEIEDL